MIKTLEQKRKRILILQRFTWQSFAELQNSRERFGQSNLAIRHVMGELEVTCEAHDI